MFQKLLLVSAYLGCLSSVFVAASGNSAAVVLELEDEFVPLHGQIQIWCMAHLPSCTDYMSRIHLYSMTGGGGHGVLVPRSVIETLTERTDGGTDGNCFLTTDFSLTATAESNRTYSCALLSGSPPETIDDFSHKGATVHVCPEPTLVSEFTRSESGGVVVTATDHCNFHGEVTWRVNGRPIPRRSAVTTLLPAVQEEDNTLAITNTDGCAEDGRALAQSVCTVTAEYAYHLDHEERSVTKTTEIPGCCIDESLEESQETTTTENTESSKSEGKSGRSKLSSEILTLKKEVLELKKQALPLQIRFLQRMTGASGDEIDAGTIIGRVSGI